MLNITELSLMTDNELMSYLSKSIKAKRIESNLMQTELAQKSGVPLGTVRAMERTGKISLVNFIKLLRALDSLDIFPSYPSRLLLLICNYMPNKTRQGNESKNDYEQKPTCHRKALGTYGRYATP